MKLWIAETSVGSRVVVYATDAMAALNALRESDRNLVTGVREWPSVAPFRMAFEPATVPDVDGASRPLFWDGISDWGESPPPATTAALGDLCQAVRDRDQHLERLELDHAASGHEPGCNEDCPRCIDIVLKALQQREQRRSVRFDT